MAASRYESHQAKECNETQNIVQQPWSLCVVSTLYFLYDSTSMTCSSGFLTSSFYN